ncbi:unnamed protein product [Zymoseptoria tritici ST99CH_1A5]|uniref:Uncharacterized protein n=1 Tax=Zymoseptoria tritici ST99CH_1A5 TaxID=1276529 RepID=A0A1Y6M1D8_ZYMTR|nr:unnamed protein product [Zymoseptoria tritici ST99CH_1A5]
MGLPIWREPEEKKSTAQIDPTACLRSSIRRRPEVHGRRTQRARLGRQTTTTGLPPRFERSPPPSSGFNGLRDSRRGEERGVPSISNLLETADQQSRVRVPPPPPPPPPAVPESRNYGSGDDTHADIMRRHEERMEALHRRQQQLRRQRDTFDAQQRQRDRMVADLGITEEALRDHFENNPPPFRREPDGPVVDGPVDDPAVNPREPLQIIRSPEEWPTDDGRDGALSRRNTLPTPPLDTSGPEDVSVPRGERRSHPLSNSWRAGSPVNGLGDRNRSPTPGDAWEIMRAGITPDETLPSAESSFASAAASRSFNASSNNTQTTDQTSATLNSGRRRSNAEAVDDSASSMDEDDLECLPMEDATELARTESLAEEMWYLEMRSPEGRERIARHEAARDSEGNRFALASEPVRIDIGFRLIEEAIETEEGRQRVLQLRRPETINVDVGAVLRHMLSVSRQIRNRNVRRHNRPDHIPRTIIGGQQQQQDLDDTPSPQPERYSESTRSTVRATSRDVHAYFTRHRAQSQTSPTSPPPEYTPEDQEPTPETRANRAWHRVQAAEMQLHIGRMDARRRNRSDEDGEVTEVEASRDAPIPHPVSPPSTRSERDVSDALLTGDVQDLDSMRRIIERLAQRDDVPEEWWMSMGLNLSRTRPRTRDGETRRVVGEAGTESRVRSGRVERRGGGVAAGSRL